MSPLRISLLSALVVAAVTAAPDVAPTSGAAAALTGLRLAALLCALALVPAFADASARRASWLRGLGALVVGALAIDLIALHAFHVERRDADFVLPGAHAIVLGALVAVAALVTSGPASETRTRPTEPMLARGLRRIAYALVGLAVTAALALLCVHLLSRESVVLDDARAITAIVAIALLGTLGVLALIDGVFRVARAGGAATWIAAAWMVAIVAPALLALGGWGALEYGRWYRYDDWLRVGAVVSPLALAIASSALTTWSVAGAGGRTTPIAGNDVVGLAVVMMIVLAPLPYAIDMTPKTSAPVMASVILVLPWCLATLAVPTLLRTARALERAGEPALAVAQSVRLERRAAT